MNENKRNSEEKDVVSDLNEDAVEMNEALEDDAEDSADSADSEGSEAEGVENEKTQEADQEDEELNSKYMRLMADFQNYKRRTEKEKGDIYAYANEKIVSELLDVIDNFERALEHGEGDESFVQGMNNIFKILKGVLEKSGLEEIEALGTEFDPNFHNAVMTEDSSEYESGCVTQVLQKGYKLNSKVIRPSMVKVAN